MQAKLMMAIAFLSGIAHADVPTPACRLSHDEGLQKRVAAELRALFLEVRKDRTDFPFSDVAVNRRSDATQLPVEIIVDAERTTPRDPNCPKPGAVALPHPAVNPDDITVSSTCAITSSAPRRLVCSESALHAIAAEADELVMRFLLAHELGHLVLEKDGGYVSRPMLVDLSRGNKSDALEDACKINDDGRVHEDAADAFAIDLLAQQLPSDDASLTRAGHQLRLGAEALRAYATSGVRTTAWPILPEDIALPASTETISWSVDHALCQFTTATKGWAAVPVFFGSHADDVTRLARAEAALLSRMKHKAPQQVTGEQSTVTQLDKLSQALLFADNVLDNEYAAFHKSFSKRFCENAKQPIACKGVPAHPPVVPQACAGLNVKLSHVPSNETWKVFGGDVDKLGDRLASLAVSDDGTIWAASTDELLVRSPPAGAREAIKLACSPHVLASNGNDVLGLCATPLRVVRARVAGPATSDQASEVVAGDDHLASDALLPNWVGAVDGTWVGSLLPPSGMSIDAEITTTGIRALPASTMKGCEQLYSGLGIWRLGKRILGTRIAPLASAQNAEFSDDLQHLRSVASETPEPLACGPSWRENDLICIDQHGAVTAGKKKLGAVRVPADARPAAIQICATDKSAWVAISTATGIEVRMPNATKSALAVAGAEDPILRCSRTAAAVGFNEHDHGRIVRLSP